MSTEDELQRITAISENTSVLQVFFPHNTEESIALSNIRRAYLNLCFRVHPDRGGIGNIEEATRCTQKIPKCFALAQEYADSHGGRISCLITGHICFNGFTTNGDVPFQVEDTSGAFKDDPDDICDGFFPSDEEEFTRRRGSRESDDYSKRSSYRNYSPDNDNSSSDDSIVFVSEFKAPFLQDKT